MDSYDEMLRSLRFSVTVVMVLVVLAVVFGLAVSKKGQPVAKKEVDTSAGMFVEFMPDEQWAWAWQSGFPEVDTEQQDYELVVTGRSVPIGGSGAKEAMLEPKAIVGSSQLGVRRGHRLRIDLRSRQAGPVEELLPDGRRVLVFQWHFTRLDRGRTAIALKGIAPGKVVEEVKAFPAGEPVPGGMALARVVTSDRYTRYFLTVQIRTTGQ